MTRPRKLDGARIDRCRKLHATWLEIAIELGCSVNGARQAWKTWKSEQQRPAGVEAIGDPE